MVTRSKDIDEAPSSRDSLSASVRIDAHLTERCQLTPHAIAIQDGPRQTCYASLLSEARAFATQCRAKGVLPGDRVVICLEKCIEYVVAIYGVWYAGAVVVPANEALVGRQISHILTDSGASAIVTTPKRLYQLKLQPPENVGVFQVELGKHLNRFEADEQLADERKEAALLYTSGSTGRPKGILILHENLVSGARIVCQYLGLTAQDRIISVLPFGFDYGLNQLLCAVYTGATLVLQRSHMPADICRTLQDQKVTVMAGVPTLWIQLAQTHSPFLHSQFDRLRLITNSGGVLPVDIVRQFRQTHPDLRICLMYGLTEAFRSTYLPPEEIDLRPNSIGKAIPETEIMVVDKNLRQCGPNQIGELVHRGPTVAMAYWNAREATAQRFRVCEQLTGNPYETVVFSGDYAHRDGEGYLYFDGRRDQLIKTLGYRVSPDEVEEILLSCEHLICAAVTSEPDAERGAAIIAHVVPLDQNVGVHQLKSYCRKAMPSYMRPKRFVFRTSIPLTASGKIDRGCL